jgi:SynChlorMet cassette radical SAM/SPASM protein ScmF
MAVYAKNRSYMLKHIDTRTGYALLYSSELDDSVFLNPIAALLWTTPSDYVDEEADVQVLLDSFRQNDGSERYVRRILNDMLESQILLSEYAEQDKAPQYVDNAAAFPPLTQIYFYATTECNARCYHCYQPTEKVANETRPIQSRQLPAASFIRVAEQALPLGLQRIKLTGGEPLLRSDLRQLVCGIRCLGLGISIETNGFLIDDAVADFLSEQNVEVSISVDGGSAKVHDRLRGHKGSFGRAIRALRMLSSNGLKPRVIMSVSKRNVGEIDNVLDVVSSAGCSRIKINPVNTLGRATNLIGHDILLDVADMIELYRRRKEYEQKHNIFLYIEGPPSFISIRDMALGYGGICPFTRILGILSDGRISYCGVGNTYPELVFGNINDSGFDIMTFWKCNATLVSTRRQLEDEIKGVCSSCVLEPSCKGSCRALAYGCSASFDAPHPWCEAAFNAGLFPTYYLNGQIKEVEIDQTAMS